MDTSASEKWEGLIVEIEPLYECFHKVISGTALFSFECRIHSPKFAIFFGTLPSANLYFFRVFHDTFHSPRLTLLMASRVRCMATPSDYPNY